MTRAYRKNPLGSTSHGHANRGNNSRTYVVWQGLRRRCLNSNRPQYEDYGGRGITVCSEWDSFVSFLADMGEAPAGMSIDRIDNEKGYYKDNCRWATRTEQNQNTRKNVNLTWGGETHCLTKWAQRLGVPVLTLYTRLYAGWNTERILTTPNVKGHNQFGGTLILAHNGETHTAREWATLLKIKIGTLHNRLRKGWTTERALTTPVNNKTQLNQKVKI